MGSGVREYSMYLFFFLLHKKRKMDILVSGDHYVAFLRPELFFQLECCFFWPQAFCKTVLCRFSYEFIGFLRQELFFQ